MAEKIDRTKKAAKNRKAYLKEREKQDRILLRLAKGEAEMLDQASSHAGLSRSKFTSKYLIPWLRKFVASNGKAESKPMPLSSIPPLPMPPAEVADEFDSLFQADRS